MTLKEVPLKYVQRSNDLIKLVGDIWSQPMYTFEKLVPSLLESRGGVYIIGVRNNDNILYVGRTKDLKRRLYTNHLMGNESTARLKKYLIKDQLLHDFAVSIQRKLVDIEGIESKKEAYQLAKEYIRKHCYFKFLPLDESRERGLLEAGLTYAFDTKFIEEEH